MNVTIFAISLAHCHMHAGSPAQSGGRRAGREAEETGSDTGRHTPRAAADLRPSRHSRKPQYVFSSSRRMPRDPQREGGGGGGGERNQLECGETMEHEERQEDDDAVFSVSVGWSTLTAQSTRTEGDMGNRQTKLFVGGREVRPDSAPVDGPREESEDTVAGDADCEDGDEKSTIISFPTSLPIVFSSQHGGIAPLPSSGAVSSNLSSSSSSSLTAKDAPTTAAALSFRAKALQQAYLVDSIKSPPSSPGHRRSGQASGGSGSTAGTPGLTAGVKGRL